MSKKNLSGTSLAQYAIIIALIALALVPVFFLLGGILKGSLEDFYNKLKGNNTLQTEQMPVNNNTNSSLPTMTKGELNGTPDKPVKSCDETSCNIDYGEFILTGVPKNMNDFVQSSGSSGGTDKLAALIDQLATQVPSINSPAYSNLLKKLADKGHEIAQLEKNLEDNANKFLENTEKLVSTDFALDEAYLSNSTAKSYFEIYLKEINSQLKDSTDQEDKNILAIVNTLSDEILSIADVMQQIASEIPTGYDVPPEKVQKLLEPDASFTTNLDSAIICKTGDGSDTGTQCN